MSFVLPADDFVNLRKSSFMDALDAFFESIEETNEHGRSINISDSSSESDVAEKVSAFTLPDDLSDARDELDDNEPEYMLKPNHKDIDYPAYVRDISFIELKDACNSPGAVEYQTENEIHVEGISIPPLRTFEPLVIRNTSFANFLTELRIERPTPVQAQAIPVAFTGQDMAVLSPTGTGKTLAFLIPAFFHILARKPESGGCGPLALILSPTEMLAHQTYLVFNKMIAYETSIRSLELTSGNLKFKQENSISKGIDVIFATPGRLMKFLPSIDWRFCTLMIVDEADRVMEEGFFRQIRSIFDYVRPDRQTMFFGATLPREIDQLLHNSLSLPVRVQIGRTGAPQQNIEHIFVVVQRVDEKRAWVAENLNTFDAGSVLLFVKNRSFCEDLHDFLKKKTSSIGYVHGQMDQKVREATLAKFKHGKIRFLIATEIAARGMDIEGVNTIVNVDVPEKPQNYVHRVGRTARAGREGKAYTLVTPRDVEFADALLQHFLITGIEPPEELIDFVEENRKEYD